MGPRLARSPSAAFCVARVSGRFSAFCGVFQECPDRAAGPRLRQSRPIERRRKESMRYGSDPMARSERETNARARGWVGEMHRGHIVAAEAQDALHAATDRQRDVVARSTQPRIHPLGADDETGSR